MQLDPKALRALQRDIEAHHDEIEEPLAKLKAEYDAVCERMIPLDAVKRAIEAKMDELKAGLVAKRAKVAAHRAAQVEATNAPAA